MPQAECPWYSKYTFLFNLEVLVHPVAQPLTVGFGIYQWFIIRDVEFLLAIPELDTLIENVIVKPLSIYIHPVRLIQIGGQQFVHPFYSYFHITWLLVYAKIRKNSLHFTAEGAKLFSIIPPLFYRPAGRWRILYSPRFFRVLLELRDNIL